MPYRLCIAVLLLAAGFAQAADIHKERIVLMPLRVGEESQKMQGAMETALIQGLQQKYRVFSGAEVAQKSREIFSRESHSAKQECDETRCMEDIAIAFQAELIATANVTKIEGGYLLALSIRNVMDNSAVFSNSQPCRDCDVFQVVDALKGLSDNPTAGIPSVNMPSADTRGEAGSQAAPPPINAAEDDESKAWQTAQDRNSALAVQAYLDKYPNGKYTVAAKSRLKRLREEEAAAQGSSSVSADDRLMQAEAASKVKGVSPIKSLPKYLKQVIPELINHKRDND